LFGKGSNQGTTTLMIEEQGFFELKQEGVEKGRNLHFRGLHDDRPDVQEEPEMKDTPSFVGKPEEPDVPEDEETRDTPSFVGKPEEPDTPEDEVAFRTRMRIYVGKLSLGQFIAFALLIVFGGYWILVLCLVWDCFPSERQRQDLPSESSRRDNRIRRFREQAAARQRSFEEEQRAKLEDQSSTMTSIAGEDEEMEITFDRDMIDNNERDAYFPYSFTLRNTPKTTEPESSEVIDGPQGKPTISVATDADNTSSEHEVPAVVAV
jgi:hypothetical protein